MQKYAVQTLQLGAGRVFANPARFSQILRREAADWRGTDIQTREVPSNEVGGNSSPLAQAPTVLHRGLNLSFMKRILPTVLSPIRDRAGA
jgi:hypothetical protein